MDSMPLKLGVLNDLRTVQAEQHLAKMQLWWDSSDPI